jgi:predicted transcriptional regulator
MTKREEIELATYLKIWFEGRTKLKRNEIIDRFLQHQEKHRNFFNQVLVSDLLQIAEKAGFKVIRNYKSSVDITEVPREEYAPAVSKKELERLYIKEKLSVMHIADMFNITREQVYYMFKQYNIEKIERIIPTKEQIEKVYGVYSNVEACKILKIKHSKFYELIKEYGIKKKSKKGVA